MDDNQNVQNPQGENDTPVVLPVEEETEEAAVETSTEAPEVLPTEEVEG